jgi:hypothetical protein
VLFHCKPVNQQKTTIFALILWEEQRLNRFLSGKWCWNSTFTLCSKKGSSLLLLTHTWWCENITASPCVHKLVDTFFGGKIFILCLFFLVNIQKQHTCACTKSIIDILTFRIRKKEKKGVLFSIEFFFYGSLNRGTLICFSWKIH